jgi:hypothetical protein
MNTESTEELILAITRKEKRRRRYTFFSIAILTILALLTLLVNISTHSKFEKDSIELESKKDILVGIDSIKSDVRLKDSLVKVVFEFYSRKQRPDSDILDLFCDTLERYYLLENVSSKNTLEQDKRYWKRFPDESVLLDSSIATSLNKGTGKATAIAKCRYCRSKDKCSDLVTVFKFDKNQRIYYVRSYYDVDKNEQSNFLGKDNLTY